LIEKSFEKTAQKNACILKKLAQKNAIRNSKKNPATQRKNSPIVQENRPTGNTAKQCCSIAVFKLVAK